MRWSGPSWVVVPQKNIYVLPHDIPTIITGLIATTIYNQNIATAPFL
jgi:hypothetical protein